MNIVVTDLEVETVGSCLRLKVLIQLIQVEQHEVVLIFETEK